MASNPLVVVDDFYPICMTFVPNETQPPLIIDPDAVLVLPIAFQTLQSISRQRAESVKTFGSVEYVEFAKR